MKTLGPRTEATPLSSGGSGRLYRLCLPAGAVKPPRLFIVDRRDRSSSLFAFPRGPYALSSSLKRCEKSKTPSRAVLRPGRRQNFKCTNDCAGSGPWGYGHPGFICLPPAGSFALPSSVVQLHDHAEGRHELTPLYSIEMPRVKRKLWLSSGNSLGDPEGGSREKGKGEVVSIHRCVRGCHVPGIPLSRQVLPPVTVLVGGEESPDVARGHRGRDEGNGWCQQSRVARRYTPPLFEDRTSL
jgi:hypothetical protein